MKALFKFVVVIVVFALMALVGAAFYIDQLAKSGIERGATYALGVDTKVDSVRLKLQSGEFGMAGLAVRNPAGFDEPFFLRVGSAALSLPLEQLMEDTIHIPRIAINDVDVTLLRRQGTANYDKIMENLNRLDSGDSEAEEAPSGGKQLIIDELVVTNIAAKVMVGLLGDAATVDVNVPEIRLTNLGSESGGMTTAELTNVITKTVLNAVIRSGGIPSDIVKDLTGQLGSLAKLDVKLSAGVGQAAANLLGGEKANDVSGNIGNVIEGLLGGIGKKQ